MRLFELWHWPLGIGRSSSLQRAAVGSFNLPCVVGWVLSCGGTVWFGLRTSFSKFYSKFGCLRKIKNLGKIWGQMAKFGKNLGGVGGTMKPALPWLLCYRQPAPKNGGCRSLTPKNLGKIWGQNSKFGHRVVAVSLRCGSSSQ